ncbi:DNA-binding transcriptional LysR family regulator [Rhizobium sp. PP-F2F-G36]|nr:DNA-binding transcriptional LysR family regulator [Rhizobium sp. PP-F2F-G36]
MTDWENLRHFAALAEAGTLSAAARLLNVDHATIARRVANLEAEIGLKLVDRRGRRLSLTVDGERIAGIARRMKMDAQAVERAGMASRFSLSADITISAPPSYAAARLARPLVGIQKQHPGLRFRVIGEARQASLDSREADIAVRLSRPRKGDLTISKIGEEAFRAYATPAYLAEIPSDRWRLVAYDESMEMAPQQVRLMALMKDRLVALRANTLDMQLAFTLENGGIAMLPDFIAAGNPELVEALPTEPPFMRDVWLLVHTDMKDVPAIRATVTALRDHVQKSTQRMAEPYGAGGDNQADDQTSGCRGDCR